MVAQFLPGKGAKQGEHARILRGFGVGPRSQALFGFQLMAVFNQGFETALEPAQRAVHLLALLLVTIACALVMAPAAYHRQAEQGRVSAGFLRLASRLIGLGLIPLMLGISLDVYVVAYAVTRHDAGSAGLGALSFAVFAGLWFALPWVSKARR
jgi:hypothetical protein